MPMVRNMLAADEEIKKAIAHGEKLILPENSPETFTEVIRRATDDHPEREIVFVEADGRQQVQTYAQLRERAEKMLAGLRAHQLQPGEIVILFVGDEDFISAFWSCLLGGFVPVPMTPNLKRKEETQAKLKHAWTTLHQPLIVSSESLIEASGMEQMLSQNLAQHSTAEASPRLATVDSLLANEPARDWHESKPEDLAYIVMSSGTTGIPKMVQMSHTVVTTRFIRGYSRKLSATSRNILLNWMPFSHSAGLQVVRPQWDQVIYMQTDVVLQEPLRWLDAIDRYGVTNVTLPNFALGAIADRITEETAHSADSESVRAWNLSTLRRIGVSTEAIVPRTARIFLKLLLPHGLSGQSLHPNYSMSEVGAMTTSNHWSPLDIDDSDRFVEVGQPDLGCSIRIVDEQEQLMTEGKTGRIQAYSPVMTPGYHQDPDRTASVFTADGWFRTGDLGFLRNGQLTVTGRHKELIIINGRNYHSTEIESVVEGVAGLEKGYTAACATRREGSNTDELVVFFHAQTSKQDELNTLLKHIRRTLNQEMGVNPAYLLPVEKVEIPRTTSGKIQRLTLKKQFEAGKFNTVVSQIKSLIEQSQQNTFVAPRTETEQMLASIWSPLLKINRVGVEDNFFELGGHSLLATQVISRIRKYARLDLPLHTLFAKPTISQLAAVIDDTLTTDSAVPLTKRAEGQATIPLSFAQQRLWFVQQLEPKSRAYHLTKALRLQGALNINALQRSLTTLVERHEALRTRFVQPVVVESTAADNLPIQIVDPPKAIELPLIDLSDSSNIPAPERSLEERETALQSVLSKETRRLFDLAADLMVRATLVRCSPDEHVLFVTMHHIASDGWSMGIFKRELSILYQAYAARLSNPLPTLPIQYADFAVWQREWLAGKVLETQLNYWQQQLAGAPPLLALPTDYPYPAQPCYSGASVAFSLSPALTDDLKALSQQHSATLYMTLLAAFNTLLCRYSQQDDIVVGSPIASRDRPELEELIGFFVNTLTLRSDLSGNPSFQTLLARVKETTLGAYAHQNIPFEELVATLKPERTFGHSPWFQVMFVFQNQPLRDIELPGLTISPFKRKHKQGNVMFDITLFMKETSAGLTGKLVYKTALFEPETIRRMAGHLETLLGAVVVDPQQPIAKLPLLTQPEQQQFLAAAHSQPNEGLHDSCIHQLFEAQVRRTPDAIALVHKQAHKNQQLTYQALNDRANRLASYLQSLGIAPDALIGLCVERSIDMIVGLLGILKAGGAYVPLDPTYPQDRLAMMVTDAQPQAVVTLQSVQNALPELSVPVVCLDSQWAEISQSSTDVFSREVRADHLAYVIYTSGSTGKPKGVMIEHRSLVNFTRGAIAQYGIHGRDRVLQFASINFDAAAEEIFPALCSGATLVIRTDEMLASPTTFMAQCQALGLTVLDLPTAYWHRLTAELPTTGCPVPPSLRLVIIGGEAALPAQLQNWQVWLDKPGAAHGKLPQIINTYGPTESTVVATAYPIPQTAKLTEVPIGQGLGQGFANAQIYLLDMHLQPVPAGIAGEIHVGGLGVARGYLNRLDLSQKRFIPNPYSTDPKARLYKTGDLARYLPDGSLKFLGRQDAQVKIRGFRIELGEIESALGEHAVVQQCTVIDWGASSGEKRLVAYVVTVDEAPLPIRELRHFLQGKLPGYMVPSAWVPLSQLPLTKNGKLNRRALPAPDFSSVQLSADYVAPRTPVEQQIAEIWAEVLAVEQVGIHDNFFELGGHSLLAIQVMARLRQRLDREIPLNVLFTTSTLEALAERCADIEAVRAPLVCANRDQAIPLSFAQQRIWFLQQLEPDNSTYKIARSLRLRGPLNREALQQALTTILCRHEALRTNFVSVDGLPTQVVSPPSNFSLPFVDLSVSAEGNKTHPESILKSLLKQEGRRPFALSSDLMLRATLFRLKEDEHVLQIVMHHIASDGWSVGVLRRELSALYTAYATGEAAPVSDLPIQYIDFSEWQRQWLSGDMLETQIAYWENQLKGAPPLLALPTDYPRPSQPSHRGAKLTFTLPKKLTDELKALAQQGNATLFMTLLSAFNTLLFRYTRQSDISVGSPIANRPHPELDGLIGLFLNTLVLRTELSDELTFEQLLGRVKKVSLEAYAHQDLPFEQLLETLRPERNMSYSPWFQVMFILQSASRPVPAMAGLAVQTERGEGSTAKFDLTLTMRESSNGLRGTFEYSLDLFKPETIERMVGHFQTLLASIVATPALPIAQLPLLTVPERKQLLLSSDNQIIKETETGCCIHQLFERQVKRSPDAIALQFQDQQLTYQTLNERADHLAHFLRQRGVSSDVLVGLCVNRSVEMIVGLLGILKAGGAYVPLDPGYPQARLKMMVSDANPQVIVTTSRVQALLPATKISTICLDSDWDAIAQSSLSDSHASSSASCQHDLAYVIYTSGSTGKPKGVMVEHRALVNFTMSAIAEYGISQRDRILQFASINFDAAVEEIFPALCTGATLVLRTDDMISSSQHFMQQCQALDLTVLDLPTAYWHQLSAELPTTNCLLPPSLRLVIIGGEAPTPGLLRSWQSWVESKAQPKATLPAVVNTYGPTEATVVATCHHIQAIAPTPADEHPPIDIPIGHSLPHVQTYVLNSQLQPTPVGIPGELYIGGNGLARGYLHKADLTQHRFIPHPFSQESTARLYKTGDLACYQPDGTLKFLGRSDEQVKIRGFRIELGEVETALSQCPSVQQCTVIAREDTPGDRRLVAYIVASEITDSLDSRQLQQFLNNRLPGYMVPSAFVQLSELPLTPSKKVDRRALPQPSTTDVRGHDPFVAPRTLLETQIANIWADILSLEQVSVYDNFFEIGGHSLLAAQVIARIQTTCGLTLPLAALFEFPTIAALAQQNAVPNTDPLDENSPLVLLKQGSPAQTPLFLIHDADGDVSLYGNLAAQLRGDRTVYALKPRSAPGVPMISSRIETICADFREQIQLVQPHGPYILGGLCIGGRLAFEIALQLQEQGEVVALVAMIDSVGKGVKKRPSHTTASKTARDRKEKAAKVLRTIAQQPARIADIPAVIAQKIKNRSIYETRRRLNRLQTRLFRQFYEGKALPLSSFFNGLSVRKLLVFAVKDYYPRAKFRGQVLLVKAAYGMNKQDPAYADIYEDPQFGWGNCVTQPLNVKQVSGGHNTMLNANKVGELESILSAEISKSEGIRRKIAP
ncbi:MAG: amino acid adenylation domain-containing protein [Cyanobacteria bacterium J06554_11]